MSVNLTVRNANDNRDTAAAWVAIQAAAANEYGMVDLSDDTIIAIARLIDGVQIANGEVLEAHAYGQDEDDHFYSCCVPSFGPALLPADIQAQVRDLLAADTAGTAAQAIILFDTIVAMGLQIRLKGTEHCPAHLKGVNWVGDDVQMNRTTSGITSLLRYDLGLEMQSDENGCGEIEFEPFAQAVNDNADQTTCAEHLQAIVACGRRRGATHIYWA